MENRLAAKKALVLGATKNSPEDCRRWDAYFSTQDATWVGLPQHIDGRGIAPDEEEFLKKTEPALLRDIIKVNVPHCADYMRRNFNEKFDIIIA